MKLLLLYPKPASGAKSRLSRTDVQLNGIADTVRRVISHIAPLAGIEVSEVVFAAAEHSNTKLCDTDGASATDSNALQVDAVEQLQSESDFIINVAPNAKVHRNQVECGRPVLHISPTFCGSFACNDISITAAGRLQQADLVDQIQHHRAPFMATEPRAHALSPDMHYAAFTPLPVRIGEDFYRSSRKHALIFLSYPAHTRNEQTRDTDKAMIADILHSNETLQTITFVCDARRDVPLVQDVADDIARALGIKPKIVGLRRGDYHDMFSVMAKTDLVLFGGNSLYADAIIRGIPVYTWRTEQLGTEPISATFKQFMHDGTREQLTTQQRTQLDRLFDALYFDATLPNHKRCVSHVLANLIAYISNREISIEENDFHDGAAWVIPEQTGDDSNGTSKSQRISRSIWQNKRELAKFRKAPELYISQSNKVSMLSSYTKLK